MTAIETTSECKRTGYRGQTEYSTATRVAVRAQLFHRLIRLPLQHYLHSRLKAFNSSVFALVCSWSSCVFATVLQVNGDSCLISFKDMVILTHFSSSEMRCGYLPYRLNLARLSGEKLLESLLSLTFMSYFTSKAALLPRCTLMLAVAWHVNLFFVSALRRTFSWMNEDLHVIPPQERAAGYLSLQSSSSCAWETVVLSALAIRQKVCISAQLFAQVWTDWFVSVFVLVMDKSQDLVWINHPGVGSHG